VYAADNTKNSNNNAAAIFLYGFTKETLKLFFGREHEGTIFGYKNITVIHVLIKPDMQKSANCFIIVNGANKSNIKQISVEINAELVP
jgi:hypothetical protein